MQFSRPALMMIAACLLLAPVTAAAQAAAANPVSEAIREGRTGAVSVL
ncbi:MAG: hypothetical protein ACT4QD_18980 [Acidobacteriota bacterium]